MPHAGLGEKRHRLLPILLGLPRNLVERSIFDYSALLRLLLSPWSH